LLFKKIANFFHWKLAQIRHFSAENSDHNIDPRYWATFSNWQRVRLSHFCLRLAVNHVAEDILEADRPGVDFMKQFRPKIYRQNLIW
jgi:hypothetical protein